MIIKYERIGKCCKKYREAHGYYQKDVARDTGYSTENISSFENGRNDNSKILLWYIIKGITIEDFKEGGVLYGKDI